MLTPSEQARIQDEIADLAEAAKRCVRGGDQYKATIILRAPHLPDGDVIVTEDAQEHVLNVVQHRWK